MSISEKNRIIEPHINPVYLKYIIITSNNCILHAKFCMILGNRIRNWTIKRIMKKRNSSSPYIATSTQIVPLLFLMMYILYIIFCAILSTRNWDLLLKFKMKRYLYVREPPWTSRFNAHSTGLKHIKIILTS